MYYAVIMAGGSGTRLWPLSREKMPKQALTLVGDRTMFQHAVDRLQPLFPFERILVVTRAEYGGLLREQVPQLPAANYILEPEGRGTAPAIGLAAVHLQKRDPQAVMAVLTADHYIADTLAFRAVLSIAETLALQGMLVTLGIQPSFPSTGFGYIEQGTPVEDGSGAAVFQVNRFVEKPDPETALQMVTSGRYTWNSGMFAWQVSRILAEFARHMPELSAQLAQVATSIGTDKYEQVLAQTWLKVKKETIDYGIMEKTSGIVVIPASIGWVDVGSWTSLYQLHDLDEHGNLWAAPHVAVDTRNILAVSDRQRLIALIGVENLIIVDSADAILVCTREREQDVREVVRRLKEGGGSRWL